MLTVTEKATGYIREALSRREDDSPEAVRISYASEAGYHLTLDNRKEGDHIFEQEGDSYLLVDPQVSEALESATLDLQDSPQGANLMLTGAPQPEGEEGETPPGAEAEAASGSPPEPEAKTEDDA